eukprot:gene28563-32262_t
MLALLIAIALIWGFFSMKTDGGFISPRNLSNLMRQMAITGIVACGMSLVIIAGEIDLSVGSLLGLLGGVAAVLDVTHHLPLPINLLLVLTFGLLVGLFNGYLTAYLSIPSFIVGLGGMLAYANLGQDEDPPFTFRVMVVRAFWPGATALQMAEQVTDKLEKKLQETPHVNEISSYSKPGETLILVELRESAPPGETAESWYQVRKKIGDIKGTLPQGVQGPFFNDEFGDTYGSIFALSGDGFTYAEMKDYADFARQQLLGVSQVSRSARAADQGKRLATCKPV